MNNEKNMTNSNKNLIKLFLLGVSVVIVSFLIQALLAKYLVSSSYGGLPHSIEVILFGVLLTFTNLPGQTFFIGLISLWMSKKEITGSKAIKMIGLALLIVGSLMILNDFRYIVSDLGSIS